jgi:hypothetical protein
VPPSPIFQMRLEPAVKQRWEKAAAADGTKLADFIREAVEARIDGRPAVKGAAHRPAGRPVARKRCTDRYGDHAQAKQQKRGLMCRECGERVFG